MNHCTTVKNTWKGPLKQDAYNRLHPEGILVNITSPWS